jgi:hypothetical protein
MQSIKTIYNFPHEEKLFHKSTSTFTSSSFSLKFKNNKNKNMEIIEKIYEFAYLTSLKELG